MGVGSGIAVGSGVGEGLGVGVGTRVGVAVGTGVTVGVGASVAIGADAGVGDGFGTGVGVGKGWVHDNPNTMVRSRGHTNLMSKFTVISSSYSCFAPVILSASHQSTENIY